MRTAEGVQTLESVCTNFDLANEASDVKMQKQKNKRNRGFFYSFVFAISHLLDTILLIRPKTGAMGSAAANSVMYPYWITTESV